MFEKDVEIPLLYRFARSFRGGFGSFWQCLSSGSILEGSAGIIIFKRYFLAGLDVFGLSRIDDVFFSRYWVVSLSM